MRFFVLVLSILSICTQGYSQSKISEAEYSAYIHSLIGGEREVSVNSGRVDLIAEDYAIEIEKAPKWKEAIGQCLWYALNTNKKPAIILIIENEKQYKYLVQLQTTLNYGNLDDSIRVFAFPEDFKTLIDDKNN